MFFNRVVPNDFQIVDPHEAALLKSRDALGALDPQGYRAVIDTRTDPIGALHSPFGGFPRSPGTIHAERMGAKLENAFALASVHDHMRLEMQRSNALVKV